MFEVLEKLLLHGGGGEEHGGGQRGPEREREVKPIQEGLDPL